MSRDAQAVLAVLRAAPGGLSVRQLAEELPWAKSKVHLLVGELAAARLVRQEGAGRTARFVAVRPGTAYPPLRAVPDPPEPAEDAS